LLYAEKLVEKHVQGKHLVVKSFKIKYKVDLCFLSFYEELTNCCFAEYWFKIEKTVFCTYTIIGGFGYKR